MTNDLQHACRRLFRLTRGATFVATLAAFGVSAPLVAQAPTPPAQGGTAEVKPTEGKAAAETFTVQFQDTDVLQALQMLAMQGRRNIVASKGVSGSISANLFDVTLHEALDVVMRANDFRMEESGNFIYVYTREEFDDLVRSRMKKVSRNFPLEYLNAKDASEFIAPILSEAGKVSFVGDVDKGFQPSPTDGGTDSWAFQGMLVVSDYPDNLAAVEKLLKDIDTPPAQVVVETTVVSSKVTQDDAFGVDVSIIGNLDFADLANPLSGAKELFDGDAGKTGEGAANSTNTNVANFGKDSTLRVGIVDDDVAVFLRMLDKVTDTTVLARPRVMALNRQKAQILIGRRVGYLTSTTTQTSTTQSVEFLDSGIKLIFRPFISSDGSIRMELAPSVSEAEVTNLVDSQGSALPVPNEDTSEIVTNIRVKDGQTLVLGGLFKEDTTIERRQVPGLGDVPIIGAAFKGYEDSLKREEIIFLVTPTIVKDDIAKIWSEDAEEFTKAVRIGAREGLLPWSRDTLTTAQNQQALEAMAKGDRDLALHHVENSLRLSHNQPEIIRLREELKGRDSVAGADYERSMMRRMLELQLEDGESVPPPSKDAAETKDAKQSGDATPVEAVPGNATASGFTAEPQATTADATEPMPHESLASEASGAQSGTDESGENEADIGTTSQDPSQGAPLASANQAMSLEPVAVVTANAGLSIPTTPLFAVESPRRAAEFSAVPRAGFLTALRGYEMHRMAENAWIAFHARWEAQGSTYAVGGTESGDTE